MFLFFKMRVILFLCFLIASVYSKTDEEMKAEFTKIVLMCMEDYPVETSELLQLQKFIVPTKTETKCLLACAYKTEGVINKAGLYDLEHAYKLAEKMKNGDEKRLENAKKFVDLCADVNEVAVSDGEKGCDRAALLFKCFTENAPKFGFKM